MLCARAISIMLALRVSLKSSKHALNYTSKRPGAVMPVPELDNRVQVVLVSELEVLQRIVGTIPKQQTVSANFRVENFSERRAVISVAWAFSMPVESAMNMQSKSKPFISTCRSFNALLTYSTGTRCIAQPIKASRLLHPGR